MLENGLFSIIVNSIEDFSSDMYLLELLVIGLIDVKLIPTVLCNLCFDCTVHKAG